MRSRLAERRPNEAGLSSVWARILRCSGGHARHLLERGVCVVMGELETGPLRFAWRRSGGGEERECWKWIGVVLMIFSEGRRQDRSRRITVRRTFRGEVELQNESRRCSCASRTDEKAS